MISSNRVGAAAATAPAPAETEGGVAEGSPHFRPAVIDGVVALDSPGQAAKKRKSLGRRVSFAAKAKVRFIDKDSDGDEDDVRKGAVRGEEENGEDDNIFLVSKPEFVVSPRRVSTGRAMLEAGKASPASEGAVSTLSNGSIEVEVRDPASSSFSSYDSVTEENVTQLDEMEMTKCVGGIIDAAVGGRSSGRGSASGNTDIASREGLLGEESDENNTMDLTSCVGGILSNLPVAPPTSPTSIDTMELTRVVGGIMENLGSVYSPPSQAAIVADKGHDGGAKTVEAAPAAGDITDMDMTVVLKDTIKATAIPVRSSLARTPVGGKGRSASSAAGAAAAPGSPSPFLVNGNGGGALAEAAIAGDSVLTMMMAPLSPVHSEISFIGDMDQPKDFALAASPAAPSGPPINSQEQAELDLTTELFNKYIDTSRFNALTLDSQPTALLPYGGGGSQVTDVKFSQTLSLPALPKTPAKVVGGAIMMAATPAIGTASPLPGPPSQTESPTVTLILPRASLKDFLNETGIRFLDNLSSLTRRETTGRPRESELITKDRQLYVDCALSLESDALDEACGVLAGQIEAIREELSRQEEQFNHSPPLAFLQYRDPQERPTVIGKLKTFKSIARLFAKQAWYEWRCPVHARLNQALASNVQVLLERLGTLTPLDAELDRLLAQLEPAVCELSHAVALLEERAKRFTTEDVEQVARMEALAAEQQTNLARLDSEMDSLVRREQELRAAIDAALQHRQELHASVASLQQDLETVPECSPLILDELRSGLGLLQGATGWKISRITSSDGSSHKLVLCHQRSAIGATLSISGSGEGATVDEVAFDISAVKSPLLKHVPRITRVPSGLAVSRCLLVVGQKLDRLCHLDKQLAIVGVQCTVSIPETLGPQLEAVPLALGFYHAPSRVKFDLLLTVDGDRLAYSQFVPFAGGLQEHHLVDAVNLSLLQKWHPIRRLVTAVTEIIEQQA